MARTRYHDFREADSTLFLNEDLRVILEAGVYVGYNVAQGGSGGLWLKFTHDTDPDNAGQVIGKLVTRDGVIIEENANQDDVVVGSLSAGTPNIHYVVASYVYNQALPNNDVAYAVRQGVAGSPPTPPSLSDDEVLIATIDVPNGAVDYSTSDIKTAGKKSIMGEDLSQLFPDEFENVLDPGIYEGMEIIKGAGDLDVTIQAGTWITQETQKIVEALQSDVFTITDPNVGNYRYAWVIGAHKNEDTDPIPSADYLLVEGSAVAVGSMASLPTDTEIQTAVATLDSKYDDDFDTFAESQYINKLGYIRVENRGGAYYIEYIRGETVLDDNTIVVYGAEARSLYRSGKYFGHQGLIEVIDDIYTLTEDDTESINIKTPYTLLLDGRFKLGDTPLRLPSHIKLQGLGAPAVIESELSGDIIRVQGFNAEYSGGSGNTVLQSTGPSAPPAGYVARTFEVQAAYRSGDDLVALKLTYGDNIIAESDGVGTPYTGWVVQTITTSNNWTVEVFIEDQYYTDGDQEDLYFTILKRNIHLENLQIRPINSGSAELAVNYAEECLLDKIEVEAINLDLIRNCRIGYLRVIGQVVWNSSTINNMLSTRNKYGYLRFEGAGPITITETQYCDVDLVEYYESSTAISFNLAMSMSTIRQLRVIGDGTETLTISATGANIGYVRCTNDVVITGDDNIIKAVKASELEFDTGSARNTVLYGDYTTFTDTASDSTNRVMFSSSSTHFDEIGEMPHSDRNLKLVSIADISWDSTTGVLTWDAPLKFDNPWTAGYSQIDTGNATLSTDGDRLYVDIARDATGTTVVVPSVRAKASASNDRYSKNRIFVALRDQNVIYMWDGTRIESGQVVQIGSTPPPDGSVTYPKFSTAFSDANTDALLYMQKFFRDYIAIESSDEWENDSLFRNTGNVVYTYTAATGVIQFTSSVDLSDAEDAFDDGMPLTILLINTRWEPGTAGHMAYPREAVLDINNSTNTVTIAKGLAVTPGAGSIWNGAIVKGNIAITNDSKVSFTYTHTGANRGRITYSSNMLFSQYQVYDNFLFVDNNGNKYKILARDTSGNGGWVDIAPGLRSVSTGTPTTKFGGSIEVNNNPYNIPLSDMRTLFGGEYIPIDTYGEPDCLIDDQLNRSFNSDYGHTFYTLDDTQRRYSQPYDPRVRLWCEPSRRYAYSESVNDNVSNNRMGYGPQGIRFVEFTGVCTGIALAITGGPSSSSSWSVSIDGEEYVCGLTVEKDVDNMYGMEQNRYELITDGRIMRLSQGVHNVKFRIIPTDIDDIVIKGLYVINAPLSSNKVLDSPGISVRSGGVVTSTPKQMQTLPTLPSYNKGQRVIRYKDSNNDGQWANYNVKTFTDTGDLSLASPTLISNVGTPDNWRVGDLIFIYQSSTNRRHIHRVTAISGSTFTVTPNIGFNSTGEDLYYYGKVYVPTGAGNDMSLYREDESVAFHCNIQEFAAAGPMSECRGAAGIPGTRRTDTIGVRLSDASTALMCVESGSGVNTEAGGGLSLDIQDTIMRIWFVGTGLSILRDESDNDCHLWVDGVYCDDMVETGSTDVDGDPGGTFICGDLPYGQHVIMIRPSNATPTTVIRGITIWQPKKPTFTGLEVLDANRLADSEASFGITNHDGTDMNGVDEMQFGTINYEAGSICNVYTGAGGVFEDVGGLATDAIIARYHDLAGGGLAANDAIIFTFFGDEITLVLGDWDVNTGGINIEFLDHDGQWKAPSSITGFTISSSYGDSITGSSAVSALRARWVMDLGFHQLRVVIITDGTPTIQFDSVEIHTPFHNYKTKQPVSIDHLTPFNNSGIDKRNLTPIPSDLLPKSQTVHMQGAYLNPTTVTQNDQLPFIFYSRGGVVQISANATITDAAAGADVQMTIDGVVDGPSAPVAATSTEQISITRVVNLPAGYHFAYLESIGALGSDAIEDVHWSFMQISSLPNQLASRGQGLSMFGPTLLGESSF